MSSRVFAGILSAVFVTGALGLTACETTDSMEKQSMMQKEEAMKKDAMMKKEEAMKKDEMMKTEDAMKKDEMMKKDTMK